MRLALSLLFAALAGPATALDAACEAFVRAAEKTAAQPARQTVSDLGEGLRSEAIIQNGQMFMQMGGKWRKGPANFVAAEKQLNAEMRSGKIKLWDCKKLGRETVDGISTTVYSYQMEIPGLPKPGGAPAKVFIGDDGLVHAQLADGVKVRHRYSGFSAPKL